MKHLSLTENHLFGKAYSNGSRFCGRYICVFVLKDKAAYRLMRANPEKKYLNRVGLTVSKKIGGAVVRSRARRVIRAALDTVEPTLRTGFIIVISAREGIADKKSTDIARELKYAFSKLGMLAETKMS
ncbi:MAG: ribonuclease P protein component [Clostridia bacterium]|nr:ribonuclease P protein component [Clostridia bacterium]